MSADTLPLTLLVSENVSAAIEVIDQHAALKMTAVVTHSDPHRSLGRLPDWQMRFADGENGEWS